MAEPVLFACMMAFVRMGGLFALVPFFSGQNVPVQLRVALAAFLAWTIATSSGLTLSPPANALMLLLTGVHELMIGLFMGLAVRLFIFTLEFAGQIISTEIGLVMSAQVDPVSKNNTTPVGTALVLVGTLLFFLSGAHHAVLGALARSFELAPIGIPEINRNAAELFVTSTGNVFLVGVQIAAPVMAVNFVVTFAFAILGKAAPSINVFSESFSVRILAGLTVLGLTLGLTARMVLSHLRETPELMLRLAK